MPLHKVVRLAGDCYNGKKQFDLPAVVQMLIDAGVDVNDLDDAEYTALHLLVLEVGTVVRPAGFHCIHYKKLII